MHMGGKKTHPKAAGAKSRSKIAATSSHNRSPTAIAALYQGLRSGRAAERQTRGDRFSRRISSTLHPAKTN